MLGPGWRYLPWEERTAKQEEEEAEAKKQEGDKGVRFDAKAFAKARGTATFTTKKEVLVLMGVFLAGWNVEDLGGG